MPWTNPKTWTNGEVVTDTLLNTHLRDNLKETAPAKVAAKGDLVAATGSNALARVPVGANDRYLKASSAQPTGMAWSANPAVECKQGLRRIEVKRGSVAFSRSGQGNYTATISVTWDNVLASIIACMACPTVGTTGASLSTKIASLSTTGATGQFTQWYDIGDYAIHADFIAIGT